MSLGATPTHLLNTSRDGDTSWAAFSADWHPLQSPLFPLRVNGMNRTLEEGISVHFSTTSPLALWVAERITVLVVSISFRVATYSFKIAGVKILWKLSSKCYKALYSILADKLENNNPCDRKGVGGSATGGGWFVDSRDCAACCDRQFVLTAEKHSFSAQNRGLHNGG